MLMAFINSNGSKQTNLGHFNLDFNSRMFQIQLFYHFNRSNLDEVHPDLVALF
jgi:hypothetical protein